VLAAPKRGTLPLLTRTGEKLGNGGVEALTASEEGFSIATVVDMGNPVKILLDYKEGT